MPANGDFPTMIGQMLGHYRIVEKIGAGGMGELFRAHDEQLERDVALKVLPAGTLGDEAARKQFRKEALALAKLNHPNIETIFDFGSQDGVDFLVMEMIPGSPLNEKLKNGPLEEREIIRLGMQFAEGLAAAHEQGVIHRDLKPGNLMITPDGRLKILDFGLAKLVHPELSGDITQSITTETGKISGTVPYMSPEQLRGEVTGPRSDLYSAGAVLYEMATGQRPFPQTQGPQLMGAILHQAPVPPRSISPQLTPGVESAILTALDKEPTRRYQSARELRVALEGLLSSSTGIIREQPSPRRVKWTALAGAGCLVIGAGIAIGLNLGGWRERLLHRPAAANDSAGTPSAAIHPRRSVAVIGFKNLSGRPDEAWLSTAFSEMLTTELAAGEKLRTVSGENVARTRIDLALADADSYAPDTLARIRKNLGSDYVVLGSYVGLGKGAGGQIRLDLRLQDAAAGETLASISETGTEAGILDLVSRAGSKLRQKLGVGEVSPADAAGVRAAAPANAEAARLYSEGMAKIRLSDALSARDLFQRAVAADPSYSLAHSALAAAWGVLGYDVKAKEEAKRAFDLSANLSREDRLSIEGRYREMNKEWAKAIEIYRTLWEFFPDNLDYGLRLAGAQVSAGQGKESLATLEAIRKLPPPTSGDPRIDLALARASDSLADFKQEQAAAAQAGTKGEAQGARMLVARARLLEGWAFRNLGEPDKALPLFDEAKRIYASAGDRSGVASALLDTGVVQYDTGDFAGARKTFGESLAIFRELGTEGSIGMLLNNIANVLKEEGNVAGAKKMFQQSLAVARETDNKRNIGMTLMNIGNVLEDEGDLAGSVKMHKESLAIAREIGHKSGIAHALSNSGEVFYYLGDLNAAQKNCEEALAISREAGDKHISAYALHTLGDISETRADFATAQAHYAEALELRNGIGATVPAAESRVALAVLSMEEGHAADAEAQVRNAREVFRKENQVSDELAASAVLVDALLAQGKPSEARKEIDGSGQLVGKNQSRGVHLQFAIASSRARAASGESAEAKKLLEATLVEATKYGFLGYQFGARLALGEMEMKSGKVAAGRARLTALQEVAGAKGHALIARKAALAAH